MIFEEGQILAKYRLQKRLGRTAVGHQTWLATLPDRESVVIKLLAFSPQMRWEELKLFEREAQVLKTLNHPRIPRYYDYFNLNKEIGGGVPWFALVQQYIPGLPLQEVLERDRYFTTDKIRRIAEEILDILIYLHQLNPLVLHRDIKPSNLILGQDERIYLIDFGAVQAQAAVTGVTFTVVGTVGYAPLEQFWGRAVPASDLYALGATLIHLLTGKPPIDLPQKDSRIQFYDRVLGFDGDCLNLDRNLIDWLKKTTELALEKRFKNAIEAKKHLLSGTSLEATNCLSSETSIKLTKVERRLEILIPAGGLDRVDAIFNSGCSGIVNFFALFYITLLLSFFSSMMLAIFPLTMSIVLWGLMITQTKVCLTKNSLYIIDRIFGVEYSKQECATKTIKDVFVQRTGSVFQVAILEDDCLYNFGGALRQDEAAWLAREIRNHLDI